MTRAPDALPRRVKASLVVRACTTFVIVHVMLRRHPLPVVVARLGRENRRPRYHVPARRLGKVVGRVLWTGPLKPRCLFSALVLYRLLRAQGDQAEFVIGLPEETKTKDAHAWVEIDGLDVGPPPGRSGHVELTRYGA
jgi:hypothetical protein